MWECTYDLHPTPLSGVSSVSCRSSVFVYIQFAVLLQPGISVDSCARRTATRLIRVPP